MNRNSKERLLLWVTHVLNTSKNLSKDLKDELMKIAIKEIHNGGLRGSISDKWREHSPLVTQLTIKDLYV